MTNRHYRELFADACFAILAGESWSDRYPDLSLGFQGAAERLFGGKPERTYQYFDGLADLAVWKRSERKVEFDGRMWVGNDSNNQWTESFHAAVVDKRITKQGIWLTMEIGEDRGEGDIADLMKRRDE